MPKQVQQLFDVALQTAALGEHHVKAKKLPAGKFAGKGIWEVRAWAASGTYRTMYTVHFREAIYVLHVFQKKSKTGCEMTQQDTNLIAARFKAAEQDYKAMYGGSHGKGKKTKD